MIKAACTEHRPSVDAIRLWGGLKRSPLALASWKRVQNSHHKIEREKNPTSNSVLGSGWSLCNIRQVLGLARAKYHSQLVCGVFHLKLFWQHLNQFSARADDVLSLCRNISISTYQWRPEGGKTTGNLQSMFRLQRMAMHRIDLNEDTNISLSTTLILLARKRCLIKTA